MYNSDWAAVKWNCVFCVRMQKGGPLRSRYTTRAKAEIRSKKRWRLKQGDQGSQPVLVVHKSSTLDPTSLPLAPFYATALHVRTQTGRDLVARTPILLTFLSNSLSLRGPPRGCAIMLLVPSFVSQFLPVGAPFFSRRGRTDKGEGFTHADFI